MREVLYAVAVVSLCCGAIHLLAPEGKGSNLKKQLTFITSLILCASLLAPIRKLLGQDYTVSLSFPEQSPIEEEEAASTIIALATAQLCDELEREITSRFAMEKPTLTLVIKDDNPCAVEITGGTLQGYGRMEEAAAYLTDLLGCPISYVSEPKESTSHGAFS